MSCLLPPNSFFFFLPPTCLSGPAPRLLAPRVPWLIESSHPHSGPAGAGDGWCPAIGLPRGKGRGAPGRGEGSVLGGRPSRGLGRLRPGARGGDGRCSPSWPNLESSWQCASRLPPGRSLCVPACPCPSLPGVLCLSVCQSGCLSLPACLSLSLCMCLISVRSFVRLSLSFRSLLTSVIVCLYGSGCQFLRALFLLFSLAQARLLGTFPVNPRPFPPSPQGRSGGWGGRPSLPFYAGLERA